MSAASLEQLLPKFADEEGVPIGDQAMRDPMYLDHHVNEQRCHHMSRVGCWKHSQMNPLRKAVHYHEDCGIAMIRRQSNNEI